MRRIIRAAAAVALAAGALSVVPAPAQAAPSLREREWWFTAWQVERIWQTTRGGGVTVAVLDTGVNAALPELSGVVLKGGDVTGGGSDGRTDVDTESKGHGTSMAALIAAQGRGTDMLGVAPDARILPVLVNPDGGGDVLQAFPAGIRFAADHGAKVISISQGSDGVGYPGGCPPQVQDAVRYAVEQRDAVVVAAAGNEGDSSNGLDFPGSCKGVLAVGALDTNLRPWASTQRQSYVDVGAPGVDIVSISSSGTGTIGSGTSPATALVSGAVALVRSAYPKLNARQAVARLLATVRDAGPQGRDDTSGYGAIRPFQAVTQNIPANAANPVFDELDAAAPSTGGAQSPSPGGSSPAPGRTPAGVPAGNASDGSDSGSLLPVVAVVVVGLALVLFVASTVVRRRRRNRPAFSGAPAGSWPGQPGQPGQPQQPWQQPPPPGQQPQQPGGQQPPQWPGPSA